VIAQSVGFMGPVFSAAFLIPLIVGANFAGRGAGIAAPVSVILAAIGTFALGWIVAEYARRVHAAGSLYDYVSQGLGSYIGAAAGWLYYGGTTVLASAIAVLIGWFTRDVVLIGIFGVSGVMPAWLWSLLYVTAVFLIMYLGVQISTRVQLTLALVSAAVLLGFFVYVIIKVGGDNSLRAFNPAEAPDFGGILFGVLYGVLIFVGFETAANLAEETAEPRRSIPRAVLVTVVIVGAYYVIAAYAQVAGFAFDVTLITDPAVSQAPVFALASPDFFGSTLWLKLIAVVVGLDIMAVGLGAAVASTRGIFALARDRRLPGPLAAVSERRGTPVGAIVFVEAVSVLFVLLAELGNGVFALPEQADQFSMFAWLSSFGGFALVVVYLVLSVGALRGLSGDPQYGSIVAAAIVGILTTAGAVFGAFYRVPAPTKWVPYYAIAWAVIGLVVTAVVRGREPASQVLTDLRSEERV
jgi:amino acid transporter